MGLWEASRCGAMASFSKSGCLGKQGGGTLNRWCWSCENCCTPTPALVLLTAVPTATPAVSILLPGQASPTPSGSATPVPTVTPVPPAGSGCRVAAATISSPLAGAVISGQVDVRGSANIPDFAFYVLEISTVGDNWLNLYTDDKPVQDGLLGRWNASLYPPGEYAFRMIVYDARGAFPEPCTIPITIGGLP